MSTFDGKDAASRKAVPVVTGVLDYFPDALVAVAELSRVGNDQHNPGQPLHWSRGKSNDHPDCLGRHLLDRGKFDTDGVRHSAKVAWRALAILQLEIEADEGVKPLPPVEEGVLVVGDRVTHREDGTGGVVQYAREHKASYQVAWETGLTEWVGRGELVKVRECRVLGAAADRRIGEANRRKAQMQSGYVRREGSPFGRRSTDAVSYCALPWRDGPDNRDPGDEG
jgi:hypothetical protein